MVRRSVRERRARFSRTPGVLMMLWLEAAIAALILVAAVGMAVYMTVVGA